MTKISDRKPLACRNAFCWTLSLLAAACLAWTANGAVVTAADGDTVVIGTDVANSTS